MTDEKIIVQLASPERKFMKLYYDFIKTKLLNGEEKLMFIVLKSFIDFSKDVNGVNGESFPTIETIQELTGWGNQKVVKIIKQLVNKGVVKKVQRGLTKSNIYIISDYATMWNCENLEELKEIAENEGVKPLTPEEHIKALEQMGYVVEVDKKKESKSCLPTKADIDKDTSNIYSNNTSKTDKSQEKYSMEQIKVFFDYDLLVSNPVYKDLGEVVIDILYDVLNTTKDTIRVQGENKPANAVVGKLMKLDYEDIQYAIDKYMEHNEPVKNTKAYLLTLLYNAREQLKLEVTNKVACDLSSASMKNE